MNNTRQDRNYCNISILFLKSLVHEPDNPSLIQIALHEVLVHGRVVHVPLGRVPLLSWGEQHSQQALALIVLEKKCFFGVSFT